MSTARVHNFSISLDGYGTGDGIGFDAPFGHAGERLHEWMFATRFWSEMVGQPGGSRDTDDAFAQQHGPGIRASSSNEAQRGPPNQACTMTSQAILAVSFAFGNRLVVL